jgi:hypothetical protein
VEAAVEAVVEAVEEAVTAHIEWGNCIDGN